VNDARRCRYDPAVAENHPSGPDQPGPSAQIIACADEEGARKEAARQQAKETQSAEWIYLRSDGKWVAKRYVPGLEPPKVHKSWKERAGDAAGALFESIPWTP